MKTNKRRGFTLVELLVVIAILAILATVSVVGYTSFIQRATVSNDENVAAQLNQFLEAYMVDHKGPYYGQEITEDNIWYITQEILEDSQYGELVPQSLEYDYHFYFDLDEGKYVVMKESDVHKSAMHVLFNFDANASTPHESRPGNSFTNEHRYFLVDTSGSPLADAVRVFYANVKDNDGNVKDIQTILNNSEVHPSLSAMGQNALFITDSGNYPAEPSEIEKLYIHGNAPSINVEDKSIYASGVTLDITVPKGISITKFALPDGSTIRLGNSDWKVVENLVDIDFVAADIIVKIPGDETEYKVVGTDKIQNGENVVAKLHYNNPVQDFDIAIKHDNASNYDKLTSEEKDAMDKVISSAGFIAWDRIKDSGIQLEVVKAVGLDAEKAISKPEYTWKVATGYTDYAEFDASVNGLLHIKDGYDFSVEYIEVVATSVLAKDGKIVDASTPDDKLTSWTFRIKLSAVKNVDFEITYDTWKRENVNTITLPHTNSNGSVYKLINTLHYINQDASTLEANKVVNPVVVEFVKAEDKDKYISLDSTTVDGDVYTTSIQTVAAGTTELRVKVGEYFNYTIKVTVADVTSDLEKKHNFAHVGSGDAIVLSELFSGSLPAGITDAYVLVFRSVNDDPANYLSPTGRALLPTYKQVKELMEAKGQTVEDYSGAYVYEDEDGSVYKMGDSDNAVSTLNGKHINSLSDSIRLGGDTAGTEITIAIFSNGVRISEDVTVEVVEAVNVSSWDDLKAQNAQFDNDGNLTSGASVVLLDDIKIPGAGNGFDLIPDGHLYGNYFTIDIKEGRNRGYGFINLKAGSVMQDVRVIGDVFTELKVQGGSNYGTNAVNAEDGVLITNCYIANTRAPLHINDNATVTVENTVLFGGRYANIDLKGSKIIFKGKIVTVNQLYKDVVGMGLIGWFDNLSFSIEIADGTDFRQYNFVSKDDAAYLPTDFSITLPNSVPLIGGTTVNLNLSEMVTGIFEHETIDEEGNGTWSCGGKSMTHWRHDDDCVFTPGPTTVTHRTYEDWIFEDETGEYLNPAFSSTSISHIITGTAVPFVSGDQPTDYASTSYSYSGLNIPITAPKDTATYKKLFTDSKTAVSDYDPDTYGFSSDGKIVIVK